jgi:DNA-directed RNA polymerase subunit RPC12/RpoP
MWSRKFDEGKMFQRLECDRCAARFNFGDSPRVTRIPRCPACGSTAAHTRAA